MGLMALAEVQPVPFAGPLQTLQVPISNCVGSSGSTRKGAGAVIVKPSFATSAFVTTGLVPKSAGVQAPSFEHKWIETPAPLFTYHFAGLAGSTATGPPSPPSISGQFVVGPVVLFTPAVPLAPRPTIMVYGEAPTGDMLSTSASDPIPPFRFWKWLASVDAHADPVSPMASSERHSPPSLPTKASSGLLSLHASACWYPATCALMQVSAWVVLRHAQPIARLHFHRSLSPASSSVSWPEGTAASARL